MSGGEARRRVAEARGLADHDQVREAFEQAVVDRPRVGMLLHAAQTASDTFVRDETVLVDTVARLGMADSTRAIDYWRQAADRQAFARDADHAYQRRGLSVSETFGGMVRLDGELDPEAGKTVIAAFGSLVEPTFLDVSDIRTMRQRRADALTELCADHLAHGHTAVSGGVRPQITLTVSPQVLAGEPGRPCELDGTVVTPETAQRIACDATITPITRNGDTVLDVGRATRTIPPAIRRALEARDGGCTHPGCHRPHRWCDAHHLTHWAAGGNTSLNNLRLLCRRTPPHGPRRSGQAGVESVEEERSGARPATITRRQYTFLHRTPVRLASLPWWPGSSGRSTTWERTSPRSRSASSTWRPPADRPPTWGSPRSGRSVTTAVSRPAGSTRW